MIIRVLDFETTGLPPDAAVIEAGWYDVKPGEAIWLHGAAATFVDPERPIPPEAKAVHHITEIDVAGQPKRAAVFARIADGADVFAAHSAAFERSFFDGAGKPWICTLKVARRIWPDAPGHSNQVLRYWRDLRLSATAASPPHRALPDAYVTAWLLHDLMEAGAAVDDMIKWSAEPSLLPRVTFGKHRGLKWAEVPADYLNWLVGKSDLDEDVAFTVRHWLKKAIQ